MGYQSKGSLENWNFGMFTSSGSKIKLLDIFG